MKNRPARIPIATWWQIDRWNVGISMVDVVAITEKTITYLERGWGRNDTPVERRRNLDHSIHPTFAEAKAHAIQQSEDNVKALKDNLQKERSALGQWKSLKEPA